MSSQITTAFVQQYSNNVQMLSQQKGSLLRNSVDAETIVGKHAFFEQVGSAVAQKRVSRHGDTPQIDTPHARRRVSMVDYEYADLIDKILMSIKNSVNCWKIFFRQSAAKLYNLKGI